MRRDSGNWGHGDYDVVIAGAGGAGDVAADVVPLVDGSRAVSVAAAGIAATVQRRAAPGLWMEAVVASATDSASQPRPASGAGVRRGRLCTLLAAARYTASAAAVRRNSFHLRGGGLLFLFPGELVLADVWVVHTLSSSAVVNAELEDSAPA